MLYLNKTLKHLNFIFIFIFYMGFIYSCSVNIADSQSSYFQVETNEILVYQEDSYKSEGYPVYIVEGKNLYINFYLNTNEIENCYAADGEGNGTASILYASDSNEDPYEVTYEEDIVKVSFYKDLGSSASGSSSTYELDFTTNVTFTYDETSLKYNFYFKEDITSPSINKFTFNEGFNNLILSFEDSYLIKKDGEYQFEYETQDLESGIKMVSFSSNFEEDSIERALQEISEDPFKKIEGNLEGSFSSDTTVSITSQDLLGNFNTSEIVLKVDSSAPDMRETLSVFDVIYLPSQVESKIEFEVVFEDQTYEILEDGQIFSGADTENNFNLNISQLNPISDPDIILT